MSQSYVVSAHPPTTVQGSSTGHFTSAESLNLVVVKASHIEVMLVTPQGLQPALNFNVYGRIAVATLFRVQVLVPRHPVLETLIASILILNGTSEVYDG